MPRNSLMLRQFFFLFFTCLFLSGYGQHTNKCRSKINNNEKKIFKKLSPVKELNIELSSRIKGITIQYLGAGGMLITKGETTIAIDPFFSNTALHYKNWFAPRKPNLFVKPDTAITKKLSAIANLTNVNAVFITHAHYDHLLDVPHLYKKVFTKQPTVYGNSSVNNLFKNLIPKKHLVNLQDSASKFANPEMHWVKVGSNIRVLPILSDHAPHYKFIKLFDGEATDSPTPEEYYAGSKLTIWKEGRTLAYLVEIMENTDTFRIHVQTSACTPNEGFPPLTYMQQIGKVDVSVFCMASFDNVDNYPDKLINYLHPQKIIIVHWENFFKKYELNKKKHKMVSFTDGLCFLERMEAILFPATVKEKCILPVPNSTIRIN